MITAGADHPAQMLRYDPQERKCNECENMKGRMNLKELKDALNGITDDDKLEAFYITHMMTGFEDPEPKLALVFFDDEDKFTDLRGMYDHPEFEKLQKFVKDIWTDAKKAVSSMIDDETFVMYTEKDYE